MKDLHGRVGLLTGASRGIGRVIAARLAFEGVRLALVARDGAALETLAAELRTRGCEARAYPADLTDAGACDDLVRRVTTELGPVQLLINNAGIERTGYFEDQSFAVSRDVVDVNLLAPLRLVHAVLPAMVGRQSGHIVLLGSMAGFAGIPHSAVYAATKAAVLALGNSLRMEFAGRGVTASTIIPGFVETVGMYADQRAVAGGLSASAVLGSCTPEDVADAVVRAIRHDVPEIIVNSRPVRPALAAGRISPRAALWLAARVSRMFAASVARARAGETASDVARRDASPADPRE